MDVTEIMSMYAPKPAKKVYLYKNGKTDSQPKCMVVNDRQVRDFTTFLNRVTSGLRAPVAIRSIYTPAGGHRVKKLDDLESGRYYVAGGTEQFKKVKYGSESKRLLARRIPKNEITLTPRHTIVASARYKKPRERPYVIHIFRNGDETYCGVRILIPPRIVGSWEHVLELVTEKSHLYTPANRLCTLDGQLLHAVSELQDGGKYVALERGKLFQKVAYCATEEKSPFRGAATLPMIGTKLKRRHHHLPPVKRAQEVGTIHTITTPLLTTSLKRERRKSRPFAGRKNKEGREKAVEDHRADSIFGGSPVRVISPAESQSTSLGNQPPIATTNQAAKTLDTPVGSTFVLDTEPVHRSGQATPAHLTDASTTDKKNVTEEIDPLPENHSPDHKNGPTSVFQAGNKRQVSVVQATEEYVEDTSGEIVFKAKTSRSESYEAEEILESGDTEVEKPLELEEAQEVTEEVGEPPDNEMVNKQAQQAVKELKSQPLQTSIDLSLQRTNLQDTTGEGDPLIQNIDRADTATSKASATSTVSVTNIATAKGARVKSNCSSRKSSRMNSRPISVAEDQALTQILLNTTQPLTQATEEKIPSPVLLTSNQKEMTEGDRVESSVKTGDNQEKEVFDSSGHSPLNSEEDRQSMVEDAEAVRVLKTVTTAQPSSLEDKQFDGSNEDKNDITEELHEDNVAGTSHEVKADHTETSADAIFVIEDAQRES